MPTIEDWRSMPTKMMAMRQPNWSIVSHNCDVVHCPMDLMSTYH